MALWFPPNARSNFTATTNPGASNDGTQGYSVGSVWVNSTTGMIFVATSVSTGAAVWKGDSVVLASSYPNQAVTGTVAETSLATVTIPANSMGANGVIRATTLWSYTNSANTKTLGVKFGGTTYTALVATTSATFQVMTVIRAAGATNSQIGTNTNNAGFAASGSPTVTSSVDTTSAVTLDFTGTLANTGETITLRSIIVELLVP